MLTEVQKNILIPVIILVIPFLLFIGYKSYDNRFGSLSYYGAIEKTTGNNSNLPAQVSEFNFINSDQKIITRKDIDGKIVVINFFFSKCSTICPQMLSNETKLAEAVAGNSDIKMYSITVDPENDTPERLKEFSFQYNSTFSNWEFLSGKKTDIYRFARKGLQVIVTDGDGGPADFIHSDMLVLIDKHGQIRGYYRGTEKGKVDELISDIKKLEK